MGRSSLGLLAATAITATALTGCSSTQTASSTQQYQMVEVAPSTIGQERSRIQHAAIYLGASDEWGLPLYDYYLAHRGDVNEDEIFVRADTAALSE